MNTFLFFSAVRSTVLVLAVTTMISLAACDSNSSDLPEDLTGTYTLHRVEDNGLPASFTASNGTLRFDSGSLSLGAGSTFDLTLRGHFDFSNGDEFDFDFDDLGGEGTYTRSGNALSFTNTDDSEDNFTGRVEGGEIVFDYRFAGVTFTMHVEP